MPKAGDSSPWTPDMLDRWSFVVLPTCSVIVFGVNFQFEATILTVEGARAALIGVAAATGVGVAATFDAGMTSPELEAGASENRLCCTGKVHQIIYFQVGVAFCDIAVSRYRCKNGIRL